MQRAETDNSISENSTVTWLTAVALILVSLYLKYKCTIIIRISHVCRKILLKLLHIFRKQQTPAKSRTSLYLNSTFAQS